MKKLLLFILLAGVILSACTPPALEEAGESRLVTIYKPPT